MKVNKVVTSFLMDRGKVLILKRSGLVGTQQGKWAGVSGYLEGDSPLEHAYIELEEETRLLKDDVTLINEGDYLDIPDSQKEDIIWRVFPFVFEVKNPQKIVLDWEHDEMKWVSPSTVKDYETIPDLFLVLSSVLPGLL